ncbi:hypothetical protein DYB32_005833 [Aphanomyces invadans]|uniref:Uncharacterized protein n=1 Tax=Aphanomyces invadans TaxID=157072 RepID=A0A3R6ZNZ9_9STRA|nr:hypothetical protein DYB32_005833 [Aphanomyces invadans]
MSTDSFSPELLALYYDRLFPYEEMVQWLGYDASVAKDNSTPNTLLSRREFSFTLENDQYIRYKAFHNADEMKTEMKRLMPHKIDIGAVFSVSVRPGQRPECLSEERRRLLRTCIAEIVFSYLYPRLDANVSKQRNHLLKSPFAIHPKTGRVCVPIDPRRIDDFNYETVPTLASLERELNAKDREYVEYFAKDFIHPIHVALVKQKKAAAETTAALTGDCYVFRTPRYQLEQQLCGVCLALTRQFLNVGCSAMRTRKPAVGEGLASDDP